MPGTTNGNRSRLTTVLLWFYVANMAIWGLAMAIIPLTPLFHSIEFLNEISIFALWLASAAAVAGMLATRKVEDSDG